VTVVSVHPVHMVGIASIQSQIRGWFCPLCLLFPCFGTWVLPPLRQEWREKDELQPKTTSLKIIESISISISRHCQWQSHVWTNPRAHFSAVTFLVRWTRTLNAIMPNLLCQSGKIRMKMYYHFYEVKAMVHKYTQLFRETNWCIT